MKLYISTCRRLPAYSCQIFCVKEVLRGKTKRKTSRLLGINQTSIVLLDTKTKALAKSQRTADLIQVLTGWVCDWWRLGRAVCRGRRQSLLVRTRRGGRSSFVDRRTHLLVVCYGFIAQFG